VNTLNLIEEVDAEMFVSLDIDFQLSPDEQKSWDA